MLPSPHCQWAQWAQVSLGVAPSSTGSQHAAHRVSNTLLTASYHSGCDISRVSKSSPLLVQHLHVTHLVNMINFLGQKCCHRLQAH